MMLFPSRRAHRPVPFAVAIAMATLVTAGHARVTRIVIDSTAPVAGGIGGLAYETVRGRAFGELSAADAHNAVITDLSLGLDADGKLRYEAAFTLTKPVNLAQTSGFLWHDVPNRGGTISPSGVVLGDGDMLLASGWQGDNAGATAIPTNHATGTNHWVALPMAKNPDGSLVTGSVLGRIVNRSGADSAPLNVGGNPIPYLPTTLDTTQATLTTHTHETSDGVVTVGSVIPSSDWAYAKCDAAHPWPGVAQDIALASLPGSLPVNICLKNGFNGNLLYQVVYPVKGAYVLGAGIAAFRDVGSFFKFAAADDSGTVNPIAGKVLKSSMRGSSQSGNFTRQFIYMGMNQDESNRKVHDGAWPQIAGRRVVANMRWGQPDGVLELYQTGSEGPQWWGEFPDIKRGLPAGSIFKRCNLNGTCPNVIEHFGSAEVYALKMTMEWVGSSADADIPVPRNVRRYYVPSTTHGGGGGGFVHKPTAFAGCPGNNYNAGQTATLLSNPMPSTQTVNMVRSAMRKWLLNGVLPPASRYPTLAGGNLVDPSYIGTHFPAGVPGVDANFFRPENFLFPVFDYDWGPQFNLSDATGVATNLPPRIKQVIPMKVPRIDADGNEVGGVPTVLNMAPLGTYVGWNISNTGFHKGQLCDYVGGYIPFATTLAERTASGDSRPSLKERYGNHDGYVAAVDAAIAAASAQGYLLPADAAALHGAAVASTVLK